MEQTALPIPMALSRSSRSCSRSRSRLSQLSSTAMEQLANLPIPMSLSSRSRSLSRSRSRLSQSSQIEKPITRAEAYYLCHTPTLSIAGGRIVNNPHYIGPPPPPTEPPTLYMAEKKPLSTIGCTSKEYQRTGVRSSLASGTGAPAISPTMSYQEQGATMCKSRRTSLMSTTASVPIISVEFFDSADRGSDLGGSEMSEGREGDDGKKRPKESFVTTQHGENGCVAPRPRNVVRFSDTVLEKAFDVEDGDTEEDVYFALSRKIHEERERRKTHLAVRVWGKGKAGAREVKKTAQDVWRVIY